MIKYLFIHNPNLYNGMSIGDLFISVNNYKLKNPKNNDKIILLTHKTLFPLVKFLFNDYIDDVQDIITNGYIQIHKDFHNFCLNIDKPLNLKLNLDMINDISEDKLLEDNSILFISHRSDLHMLEDYIVKKVYSYNSSKKIYIRNVKDNFHYNKTIIESDLIKDYSEDLMCLIASCMRKKIKIIMNRSGLVDLLMFITKIPILIIYPPTPNWIEAFNISIPQNNSNLIPDLNEQLYEYFETRDRNNFDNIFDNFINL